MQLLTFMISLTTTHKPMNVLVYEKIYLTSHYTFRRKNHFLFTFSKQIQKNQILIQTQNILLSFLALNRLDWEVELDF